MRERIAAGLAVIGLLLIGHAIVTRSVTPLPAAAVEYGVGVLFLVLSVIVSYRAWL